MVMRSEVERALSDVDDLVVDLMNRHASPGLSLAVVHDGEVVHLKGYGLADVTTGRAVTPDTVFRIGSTSKTMTAIALMQLWEAGRFDLDDPVAAHLTSYQLHQPRGTRPVTIRDMLTHTSGSGEGRNHGDLVRPGHGLGIPEGQVIPPLRDWYPKGLRTEVEPGHKWAYANHAVATLGQVVEDVSGVPFASYVRDNIFTPLGMDHSDFERNDRVRDQLAVGYGTKRGRFGPVPYQHIVPEAAGSVYSSARDMTRYMTALMHGGSNDAGTVLKPESLERMYLPLWQIDPRLFSMGVLFMLDSLNGHRVVHHGGGWKGFVTMMRVAPDDKVGVFAVTNSNAGSSWHIADVLLRRILDVPQVGEDLPRPGILERPDRWGDLVGVYKPPPGPLTNARIFAAYGNQIEILAHDGKLHAQALRGTLKSPVRLYPTDPTDPLLFTAKVWHGPRPVEAKFLFEVDENGRAVALRGEDDLPFQLYRAPDWRNMRNVGKVVAGATVATVGAAGLRRLRPRR